MSIFALFYIFGLLLCQSSDVIELTDDNFESLTQIGGGATTGHWMIEFFAPWCGHCKNLAPTYEQVATELKGKINVAKVDATQQKSLSQRFNIRGYPTILFFKGNKMTKYSGPRTVEKMKEWALSDSTEGTDPIPPKGSVAQEAVKPQQPKKTPQITEKNMIIKTLETIVKIFETSTLSAIIILLLGFSIGFLFGLMFATPTTKIPPPSNINNYIPPPPSGQPPSVHKPSNAMDDQMNHVTANQDQRNNQHDENNQTTKKDDTLKKTE